MAGPWVLGTYQKGIGSKFARDPFFPIFSKRNEHPPLTPEIVTELPFDL